MKKESFLIASSVTATNGIQIVIEGLLIIRNIEAIKKEFLLALNSSQSIELVLRNVIKLDMAVLQLLIALQKSARKIKTQLSFDMELTDAIKTMIRNAGLEKALSENKSQANGIH